MESVVVVAVAATLALLVGCLDKRQGRRLLDWSATQKKAMIFVASPGIAYLFGEGIEVSPAFVAVTLVVAGVAYLVAHTFVPGRV